MFKELEKHYYRVEMPKVRQSIAAFRVEIGNYGKCLRLSFLYDRLIALDSELFERKTRYRLSFERDRPYIERAVIAYPISEIKKEMASIEREISFIVKGSQGKISGTTPAMIEQAREYPLDSLIQVKRSMARCPFHDDHRPSMGIKHNRFHCFACGARGDVIEFIMRKDNLSFLEAVRRLAMQI